MNNFTIINDTETEILERHLSTNNYIKFSVLLKLSSFELS